MHKLTGRAADADRDQRRPLDINAALAGRLRAIREGHPGGESVPEMAQLLGLPEATWANYEAGVVIPGHVLLAFLVATSAEPRWLLSGTGPRYSERPN